MHRISLALADSCVYKEQKVQLAGLNIRARIGGVWVGGKQVSHFLEHGLSRIKLNHTGHGLAEIGSIRQ